jgi:hypothetical protein
MDARRWNERYPAGTAVQVRLADGRQLTTRTEGPAASWGGLDHVPVEGIRGYILLSWVRPAAPPRGDECSP